MTDDQKTALARTIGEELIEMITFALAPLPAEVPDKTKSAIAISALVGSAVAFAAACDLDRRAAIALIHCTAEGLAQEIYGETA